LEAERRRRVEGKRTRYLSFLLGPCPATTEPIFMMSPSLKTFGESIREVELNVTSIWIHETLWLSVYTQGFLGPYLRTPNPGFNPLFTLRICNIKGECG
jgi:hypothetical protein